MNFEIKTRDDASVLFSMETASLKLAVEAAIKSGAHLSGAHLSGANLSGAHLSGADLSKANLSKANLSWAHLSWAHLSGAHLSWADLSGATIRNGITVKRAPLQVSCLVWPIIIWDSHMQIGCEFHSIAEWAAFDDEQIAGMHNDALRFWGAHKAALLALAKSDGRE